MHLKLKRTPGIYLVGFMGSGKTTVGRTLAWELGWNFIDIDDDIESQQGVTIAEIFDTRGEAEFRQLESIAIRARVRTIERGKPCVVALGGGAFTQPETVRLLEDNGISIWLDCSFETIKARLGENSNRPLARDPVKLAELYETRRPIYALADFRIAINCDDPNMAVGEIMNLPLFL